MADAAPEPVYNIVGERAALGPSSVERVLLIHRWFDDFWIVRTYGGMLAGKPIEVIEAWFERERDPGAARWFAIFERDSGRPTGITDLFRIELDHGLAWLGMPIGEEATCGTGNAAGTARLMLGDAFTALNLRTVMPMVDECNGAARRTYTRAGFGEVGRGRGAILVAGTHDDRIVTDCASSDFESPVPRARLIPN